MKYLILAVAVFLSLPVFAKNCPSKIILEFGVIEETTSDELISLETKKFELKKIKGTRVCHYTQPEELNLKLKYYNFNNSRLVLEEKGSASIEGSFLEVKMSKPFTTATVRKLNAPIFDHYLMYFDEDGCAFGQVPCEEYPEVVGYTRFNQITFRLRQ